MNLEPKKKAEELFYKFFLIIDDVYNECRMHKNEAKQCALIAVDELKNMDWYIPNKEEWNKYQNFLDEVKQEIEKL